MKNQRKHFPFLNVFIYQTIAAGVICGMFEISLVLSGLAKIVTITLLLFLLTTDLVLMILSFTLLWNVPLIIDRNGISKKGGKETFPWDKATSILIKKRIRLQYGPMFTTVTINYSDGRFLRFEASKYIFKDISELCTDQRFIAMLEEAKQK